MIVRTPKTRETNLELLEIVEPSDPNSAPYEMNRSEKPKTNNNEPSATLPLPRISTIPAA